MSPHPFPTLARHIVDRLGGRSEAARLTGYPLTKIDSWLRSGFIPCRLHSLILESAWAAGITMNELDFVAHLRGITPPSAAPERTA